MRDDLPTVLGFMPLRKEGRRLIFSRCEYGKIQAIWTREATKLDSPMTKHLFDLLQTYELWPEDA